MSPEGPDERAISTGPSYDRVAAEYVRRIAGELDHKPMDRELLDRFADAVRAGVPVRAKAAR